jgi:GNAT superfamily N-acetyltransferase
MCDSDDADSRAWLSEALAAVAGPVRGPCPLRGLAEVRAGLDPGRRLLVVAQTDARPIGVLVLAPAGARGLIETLAIAAPHRNLGLGEEAVRATEAMSPASHLLAGVPRENGLAIYFWLRCGYRPLYPARERQDLPAERVWFARPASVSSSPMS